MLDDNGSGTTEQVVAGIDWVTQNHQGPSVANMSLGGGVDEALDTAVSNSIASGVTYAIAAGNSSADASGFSPARVPEAITVAASDINDAQAEFSNFGELVDIYGPGVDITSAWNTDDQATDTISGTSMATPHVAGAAALFLSANPDAAPADVLAGLTAAATPDKITNASPGTPNKLLYTGAELDRSELAQATAAPGSQSRGRRFAPRVLIRGLLALGQGGRLPASCRRLRRGRRSSRSRPTTTAHCGRRATPGSSCPSSRS